MAKSPLRGYTKAFRPKRGTLGHRYCLDKIPASLWTAVVAKCKRDGLSVRGITLTLLQRWVAGETQTPEELFDVAKRSSHAAGVPWTDPRTGIIYPPPALEPAGEKA